MGVGAGVGVGALISIPNISFELLLPQVKHCSNKKFINPYCHSPTAIVKETSACRALLSIEQSYDFHFFFSNGTCPFFSFCYCYNTCYKILTLKSPPFPTLSCFYLLPLLLHSRGIPMEPLIERSNFHSNVFHFPIRYRYRYTLRFTGYVVTSLVHVRQVALQP